MLRSVPWEHVKNPTTPRHQAGLSRHEVLSTEHSNQNGGRHGCLEALGLNMLRVVLCYFQMVADYLHMSTFL